MAKRITALLLALVLVLSLVACKTDKKKNKDKDPEATGEEVVEYSIVGTWETEFDLKDVISMGLTQSLGTEFSVDGSLMMPITLTLSEDGTASLYADADIFKENFKTFVQSMNDVFIEMLYQRGEAEGTTREEMDAQLAASGLTMEGLVSALLSEMDFDQLIGSMDMEDLNEESFYKYEDGKLYIEEFEEDLMDTEDYTVVTLDADTLTFESVVGEGLDALEEISDMGFELLPMVFTRK